MTEKLNIIFVSLAQNQSRFFEKVGRQMERAGYGVVHICFHENAVKELNKNGCEAFNPYAYQPICVDDIFFESYHIDNPALLLGHEKAAYEIYDTFTLEKKFKGHLGAMDTILSNLSSRPGKWCLVQELGGFTPVLAAYFSARRIGIDIWFIEPSFFRGRLFFTLNNFLAPVVRTFEKTATYEVQLILAQLVDNQSIVIPIKDSPHYRHAGSKLMDCKNYRRLIEKLIFKYINKEQEEFQHIAGHIRRHIRMYINTKRNSKFYTRKLCSDLFIYYPLHVPADFALTIRSPEYLDQYSLIDYLCRIAPLGYRVIVKEHPALVGALDTTRVTELIKRHDNFVLLSPTINNHDVLAAANTIVTVNSKSGAEAMLYKKPVIVLGNAFYEDCLFVFRIQELAELKSTLKEAIKSQGSYGSEDILPFFQCVWDLSFQGELYDVSEKNIVTFSSSLMKKIT